MESCLTSGKLNGGNKETELQQCKKNTPNMVMRAIVSTPMTTKMINKNTKMINKKVDNILIAQGMQQDN